MPRGNFFAMLAGLWWPLVTIDAYVFPLGISRLGPSVPFWFTFTLFLLTSIGLAGLGLLGMALESEAPRQAAAV